MTAVDLARPRPRGLTAESVFVGSGINSLAGAALPGLAVVLMWLGALSILLFLATRRLGVR